MAHNDRASPRRARRVRHSQRRARRLPPAERRAHLLACALRVFARRGVGAAHHAEIAREAGVSVSTVFVYFPTRRALVGAVLDEVERFLTEMAERIHAAASPAPQVILEHARAFAASCDTHPDHLRVWMHWSLALDHEVWPRYLAFQEHILRLMARTLRRGLREGNLAPDIDADDDARLVVGAAHMVAQMKFTKSPPATVERFLRALARAAIGTPARPSPDPRHPVAD